MRGREAGVARASREGCRPREWVVELATAATECQLGSVSRPRPCQALPPSCTLVQVLQLAHRHASSRVVAATVALMLSGVVFATLATAGPAAACSVCGCGDPLLAASDPAAITGQLRLQIDTEYLRIDAGTDGQPGYTDKLTQWSYRFNAVYRPLDALSLTATLPLLSKTIHTVGGGTDVVDSDRTGLGDLEIAARYALWRSVDLGGGRLHEFAVTAGTALPTGEHNAKAPDGSLIDPHGQLGTGGWGPFVGINYRFEQGSWLAFANLSGRLRTEATYFDSTKYKFGDALLWSVHGQYRPVRWVALDLGVDGRYAQADKATDAAGIVDAAVVNTGGTVLSAAPGVYFNTVGGLWLFVRGQIPFYESLFGGQDVLPSLTMGVQFQAL